jgi:hypothetical protein
MRKVIREIEVQAVTTFPVPVHAGKTIKTGTLRGVLRLAKIDLEALIEVL